jgi:hypothetical protein
MRFGYRRLRVLMVREGWEVGKERFYRVYIEEGSALRRKRSASRHRVLRLGIRHARYYWLLLSESYLTRRLFGAML